MLQASKQERPSLEMMALGINLAANQSNANEICTNDGVRILMVVSCLPACRRATLPAITLHASPRCATSRWHHRALALAFIGVYAAPRPPGRLANARLWPVSARAYVCVCVCVCACGCAVQGGQVAGPAAAQDAAQHLAA